MVARGLKGVLSTFRKATPVIQEGKEEQIEEQVKEKQLLGLLKKANEILTWTSVKGRGRWSECWRRCCR